MRRFLLVFYVASAGVFLTASNAWAATMTLPGTGFNTNGNALGNYGVDANWTVSGSQYGGSAAYVIVPSDPDWGDATWIANTASNGWSGSSWINDNNQYSGGGSVVPYTYSMSFSLGQFLLDNNLQITGLWGVDDTGTLAINGHAIGSGNCLWGGFNGLPAGSFSLSYAANPTWFNVSTNIITVTMTSYG